MTKVSKIQERFLRLKTNNYKRSYEDLLDSTNKISLHNNTLNSLKMEVCKCLNGLSPDIMNDAITVLKYNYNTRHDTFFVTDRPKADRYGRNSIPCRVNQICNLMSREIKNSPNLDSFKSKNVFCFLLQGYF